MRNQSQMCVCVCVPPVVVIERAHRSGWANRWPAQLNREHTTHVARSFHVDVYGLNVNSHQTICRCSHSHAHSHTHAICMPNVMHMIIHARCSLARQRIAIARERERALSLHVLRVSGILMNMRRCKCTCDVCMSACARAFAAASDCVRWY